MEGEGKQSEGVLMAELVLLEREVDTLWGVGWREAQSKREKMLRQQQQQQDGQHGTADDGVHGDKEEGNVSWQSIRSQAASVEDSTTSSYSPSLSALPVDGGIVWLQPLTWAHAEAYGQGSFLLNRFLTGTGDLLGGITFEITRQHGTAAVGMEGDASEGGCARCEACSSANSSSNDLGCGCCSTGLGALTHTSGYAPSSLLPAELLIPSWLRLPAGPQWGDTKAAGSQSIQAAASCPASPAATCSHSPSSPSCSAHPTPPGKMRECSADPPAAATSDAAAGTHCHTSMSSSSASSSPSSLTYDEADVPSLRRGQQLTPSCAPPCLHLVSLLQPIPWWLRIYLHTLKLTLDSAPVPLYSSVLLASIRPAVERKAPAMLELLLAVPCSINRVVLSLRFRKVGHVFARDGPL